MTHPHWAIYSSTYSENTEWLADLLCGRFPEYLPGLHGKKGALFSAETLRRFILEEALHDDYRLTQNQHRSIRTFSSGEQKKALLKYLLANQPGFLVVDNVFDMLDAASREELLKHLVSLSEKMPMVQIFRRRDNLLPFIDKVLEIEGGQVVYQGSAAAFLQRYAQRQTTILPGTIPVSSIDFGIPINPLVRFNSVSVSYGPRAILDAIHWEIRSGDFWHLIGPNGSGKTTLLTMITGDNPQAYGQDLILFGRKKGSGESIWEIKKKIGYVTPAMTVLFKGWHSVERMVISGLYDSVGLYRQPTTNELDLALRWLELMGLASMRKQRFADLSEGRQCMVLIARAMVKHPPLLILDEPIHGLDDQDASLVVALIHKIATESQTTLIYVSHQQEAGLYPNRVFELIPGENGSKGRELHPNNTQS